MRKRYEVAGMMEWHPVLTAGKSRIRIPFTGGHLCGGGTTPASFETSDPVVQTLIERSEHFRLGRIRLGLTAPGNERHSAATSGKDSRTRSMTCETLNDAIDRLHYDEKVPLENLMTREAVEKEASALGISLSFKTPQA